MPKGLKLSDKDIVSLADSEYGSDDIEIDENPKVSRGDEGAFVRAWVWVSLPGLTESETEGEAPCHKERCRTKRHFQCRDCDFSWHRKQLEKAQCPGCGGDTLEHVREPQSDSPARNKKP